MTNCRPVVRALDVDVAENEQHLDVLVELEPLRGEFIPGQLAVQTDWPAASPGSRGLGW